MLLLPVDDWQHNEDVVVKQLQRLVREMLRSRAFQTVTCDHAEFVLDVYCTHTVLL